MQVPIKDGAGKTQSEMSKMTEKLIQWEFQDPKVEVLYHIRPYFGGTLHRPYIW